MSTSNYTQNSSYSAIKSLSKSGKLKYSFAREIILYEEPNSLPDTYGTHVRLDQKEVSDYGHSYPNLECTDYQKAFSPPETESQINEIDSQLNRNNKPQTLEELQKLRELTQMNEWRETIYSAK